MRQQLTAPSLLRIDKNDNRLWSSDSRRKRFDSRTGAETPTDIRWLPADEHTPKYGFGVVPNYPRSSELLLHLSSKSLSFRAVLNIAI